MQQRQPDESVQKSVLFYELSQLQILLSWFYWHSASFTVDTVLFQSVSDFKLTWVAWRVCLK